MIIDETNPDGKIPDKVDEVCLICHKGFKEWGNVGNILRLGMCEPCMNEILFDEDEE